MLDCVYVITAQMSGLLNCDGFGVRLDQYSSNKTRSLAFLDGYCITQYETVPP